MKIISNCLSFALLIFAIGCGSMVDLGTKAYSFGGGGKKEKPDISNSPSLKAPFDHIKIFNMSENFDPSKFQCLVVGDIQTNSESDFAKETEYNYGVERLLVQTDKLKGDTLKITSVAKKLLTGRVFDCNRNVLKK